HASFAIHSSPPRTTAPLVVDDAKRGPRQSVSAVRRQTESTVAARHTPERSTRRPRKTKYLPHARSSAAHGRTASVGEGSGCERPSTARSPPKTTAAAAE